MAPNKKLQFKNNEQNWKFLTHVRILKNICFRSALLSYVLPITDLIWATGKDYTNIEISWMAKKTKNQSNNWNRKTISVQNLSGFPVVCKMENVSKNINQVQFLLEWGCLNSL